VTRVGAARRFSDRERYFSQAAQDEAEEGKHKMKNISRILVLSALTVMAVAANAQVKGRSFTYKAADAISQDFSGSGDMAMKVRTTIKVNPYLYIAGNLGAEWTVDGWGTGVDSKTESIKFFHNETLTLDLEGFANPTKIDGTKTGAQEIEIEGQLSFFNDQDDKEIFNSDMVAVEKLNEIFNPSGPNFEVAATGGLMRLDFGRKITINPQVGPGTYENVGIIKVIRN
jgi:hypothetical protein